MEEDLLVSAQGVRVRVGGVTIHSYGGNCNISAFLFEYVFLRPTVYY